MISRVAAFRTLPRAFAAPARLYTIGRTEGSVAESKGFGYVSGPRVFTRCCR